MTNVVAVVFPDAGGGMSSREYLYLDERHLARVGDTVVVIVGKSYKTAKVTSVCASDKQSHRASAYIVDVVDTNSHDQAEQKRAQIRELEAALAAKVAKFTQTRAVELTCAEDPQAREIQYKLNCLKES